MTKLLNSKECKHSNEEYLQNWKKIFTNYTPDRGVGSRIHKELKKQTNKNPTKNNTKKKKLTKKNTLQLNMKETTKLKFRVWY
jgi:hypothetical protein